MSRTDAELLAATAAGDADAFGCFYRRHEALVLAYAFHRCTNASDVADLVADTFIGALRSAPRFAKRDGDAVAWLLTIARRPGTPTAVLSSTTTPGRSPREPPDVLER